MNCIFDVHAALSERSPFGFNAELEPPLLKQPAVVRNSYTFSFTDLFMVGAVKLPPTMWHINTDDLAAHSFRGHTCYWDSFGYKLVLQVKS